VQFAALDRQEDFRLRLVDRNLLDARAEQLIE
jgi:hypothetical protein